MFMNNKGLLEVVQSPTLTTSGVNTYNGCVNLSSLTFPRMTAPTAARASFGTAVGNYCGENSKSLGINVLRIPQGATGYDTSLWSTVLQNENMCGFHIEYIT